MNLSIHGMSVVHGCTASYQDDITPFLCTNAALISVVTLNPFFFLDELIDDCICYSVQAIHHNPQSNYNVAVKSSTWRKQS